MSTLSLPSITPNVAQLLWTSAESHGASPAIIERDRTTDFASLRDQASAIAGGLVSRGVRPGDRVAILLPRGATAAAAYFGALAAGAVTVFVNERLRPRQIEYVLSHSGASILLTTEELLSRQPRALQTDTTVIDVGAIGGRERPTPCARVGADLAQIIYTSGSTGQPKGVTFSHGQLLAALHAVVAYLDLRADDRIASLLPFSSVYGLNQLLCAVSEGAALLIEQSPVPQQIASALRARGVTVLAAVPPLWLQLLSAPAFCREAIASLRILQNAGGHLPPDAVRRLREVQPQAQLFLQYGMTETFRSTYLPPDEVDRHPDSMGRAVPGAEILVVRDDDRPCAEQEVGELVFRGPSVATGYWRDPHATARAFRANPLRPDGTPDSERVVYSGDLVRRDGDGLLYFVSRRDRLIKTLGFRVGPDEVLDVLFASGDVAEGLVVGEPDDERGERIVAHVVLTAQGTREHLEQFARAELPRHMQPARLEIRTEMPRLASGKYDVAALRPAAAEPATPLVAPGG